VVKLADTQVLGTCAVRLAGSSPVPGTKMKTRFIVAAIVLILIGIVVFPRVYPNSSPKLQESPLPSSSPDFNSVIKTYLNNNYPGYTIQKISSDPLCSGGDANEVIIKVENNTIPLIFTPTGEFVQSEKDIPYTELPKKVSTIIQTDFKDYTHSDTAEELTLADKEKQYMVDFFSGSQSFEAIFDPSGKVVCKSK
jgi:hypothetical protein